MKKLLFTLIFVASFFVNVDGQNFEWGRGFTGMGSAYSTTLAVDNSGNVYSAGLLSGVVDFDPEIGLFNLIAVDTNDLFVSKLDSDGNFLWAKQIGGNVYNDGVTSVAIDLNGDVIITGWFQSTVDFDPSSTTYYLTSQGAYDIFILKLDSAGNFIWANKIGGNGDDNCNSIVVDDSNNLVITGFFAGVVDFNPGQGFFGLVSIGAQDIFVSKYTNSGSFIWAKAIGGTGGDVGLDLALSPLDDVYCTGHFSNAVDFDPNIGVSNLISNGLTDIFIFKLDSDGNFIWAKSFGGVNSDGGNSIAIDVSGDLVSTGWFQGIVDFDPSNNVSSITPIGFKNAFVSKFDSSGNFKFAKAFDGPDYSVGHGLAVGGNCDIYSTGYFGGQIDFDPNSGTENFYSNGYHDIYLSQLDSAGNYIQTFSIGGIGYDDGNGIVVNSDRHVYVTGGFQDSLDIDPTSGIYYLSCNSIFSSAFLLKLSQTSTGISQLSQQQNFSIYPNPSNGNFTIEVKNKNATNFEIYNVMGEKIFSAKLINPKTEIELKAKPGMYFYQIKNDDGIIENSKIVIQ